MTLARCHSGPLAVALALTLFGACRCGDSGAKPLAHVGATAGEVERNPDVGEPWAAAARGDAIYLGGAVRTGTAATAAVDLASGGGRLSLGELSIVRFARSQRDAFHVDLQTGTAEIETGSVEILLTTSTGTVRLLSGTRARAVRTEGGLEIEVIVGSAEIEGEGQPATTVAAGEEVTVTPAGVTGRSERDAGPDQDQDQDVRIEVAGGTFVSRSAGEADVTVPGGESATIHVIAAPVRVRVQFEAACPAAGLLEVSRRPSFRKPSETVAGSANAIATFNRGTHYYRVRCADGDAFAEQPSAEGKLRVIRDERKPTSSKSVPHNEVEADGRKYTVMYQNRMPKLTFKWPDASPSPRGYVLRVRDARDRVKTFKGKRAAITVKPSALSEGRYSWWMETAGPGSTRSPITQLRIDFDNAAPAAYIRKPSPGDTWGDDAVRVEGTALRGSTVSAGGVGLPLDRHFRFAANVSPPEGGNAIAIRIAHPKSGVHYYVRRRGTR